MTFPSEIQRGAKQVFGITKPGHPLYYAWAFDPDTAEVHISDDHKKPRKDKEHHKGLAKKVKHPEAVHGYAYRLRFGWRITDREHHPVDNFIMKKVARAIKEHENE